jgi:hypothetical protein
MENQIREMFCLLIFLIAIFIIFNSYIHHVDRDSPYADSQSLSGRVAYRPDGTMRNPLLSIISNVLIALISIPLIILSLIGLLGMF